MRRIPIRTKLAAALLVPLVGLVSVTVVEVAGTTAHRGDVRAQTELARASVGPGGVITSLQNERAWTVIELVGQQDVIHPPVVGYQEVRRATDEAIAAFRQALEGDPVAREYGAALRGLSGLAGLRQQVDANTAPRDPTNRDSSNQVFAAYTELVTPFLDANDRVALRIDDAELRQLTSLVDTATRQLEIQAALARATIRASAREAGTDRREEIAGLARLRSRFADGNAELMAAPPPFDQVVRQHYPGRLVEDLSVEVERALAGEPVRTENLLGALDVPADGGYRGVRNALVDRLMARADDLNDAAGARQRSYLAVAGLTLAAALLLTWMVSRSITRPLRALTRQAKDMADHRLPDAVIDILQTPLGQDIAVPRVDPVRVPAHDEVADVADALNTVQETALDLAVEQAVLRRNIADSFVNLGRRNQNLLGRQLDFITELESNETDP
ncbi:MAG TPA: nitrate- and nitrite sensing domain-containing protein, partial [Acidimicrobiales bacterium]|nr:nitrate- and nitrite sensing domain-containing protein [Acidimicrobiales bacterium]